MATKSIVGIDANNWDHLLDSLKDERCIICLGPEVYTTRKSGRLEQQLADFLKKDAEQIRIRVYDDGWFHYLPGASEIDAWQKIKEFYKAPNEKAAALLDKIAQIPFHFLLNFTPDYHLKNIFEGHSFAYNFLSYLKKVPFDQEEEANKYVPTRLKPLVFNMLGEVKKRNSLVMTYNDFYTYLESIFEGNSMSLVLKENIWEADYFIFLGMPFDRWYVHMFMRILQQHEQNRSSKKYAANLFLSNEITTHCAEQYTMTFVPTDIESFVDTFYQKCQARGFLRTAAEARKLELPMDQLRSWAGENEFQLIFDQLIVQLTEIGPAGAEWKNEVIQLEGRHNDLKRSIRMGTIDDRDRIVETNRIRAVVLELFQSLQKHFN